MEWENIEMGLFVFFCNGSGRKSRVFKGKLSWQSLFRVTPRAWLGPIEFLVFLTIEPIIDTKSSK